MIAHTVGMKSSTEVFLIYWRFLIKNPVLTDINGHDLPFPLFTNQEENILKVWYTKEKS